MVSPNIKNFDLKMASIEVGLKIVVILYYNNISEDYFVSHLFTGRILWCNYMDNTCHQH